MANAGDWVEMFGYAIVNKDGVIVGVVDDELYPPSLAEAATDLLAALEEAVRMYGQQGGPWNVPSHPGSWIAQAKASIAKAKGWED